MILKKLVAMICAFSLLTLSLNTVLAADGSVYNASVADTVKSYVNITGSVEDTSAPINMIVTKTPKGGNVTDSAITYINQAFPEGDGKWEFTFSINGNISDYNVLLRQDGVTKDTIELETISSITDAINAELTAQLVEDIVHADITVNNPLFLDTRCTMFIAMYDNKDNLVDTETIDINEIAQSKYYKANFHKKFLDGAEYAKVFFWSEDLIPLSRDIYAKEVSSNITLTLDENPELITKNPGKGWVRYGETNYEVDDAYSTDLDKKALDYSSVGYMRYNWSEIETTEGVYNWSRIDNAISYWKNRGMKFAFGIMCGNTALTQSSYTVYADGKAYSTPKWVFDAGAKSVEFIPDGKDKYYVTPYFNDPIFLEKCEKFVKKLAERYDGNPDIAWIDARSYGNYGEYHPIDFKNSTVNYEEELALGADDIKKHILMYADAFDKTQIIVCSGAFYYPHWNLGYVEPQFLIDNNVGTRHDGANTIQKELGSFTGYEPTISEIGPPYISYKEKKGWEDYEYLNHFKESKLSYMDIGEWSNNTQAFIEEQEHLIKYLTNKMGYHFVLNSVSVPRFSYVDSEFDLTFKWINKGITYLYEDCTIQVALLDKNNNVVDFIASDATPTRNWAPDTVVTDSVSFRIGDIADGDYKLAVGLHLNDDGTPDYKIGNYGITDNGWYVFANVEKCDERFRYTKYDISDSLGSQLNDYAQFDNGSFENGMTNWNCPDDSFGLANVASDGTNSLYYNGNHNAGIYRDFSVDLNRMYEFSIDINSSSPVKVLVETIEGKTIREVEFSATSGNWSTQKIYFDLYDAGEEIMSKPIYEKAARLVLKGETGKPYYVDNIVLTAGKTYSELLASGNIIKDYGAETAGQLIWRRGTSSVIKKTDAISYEGNYSYMMTATRTYTGAIYDYNDFAHKQGAGTYKFEAYLRAGNDQKINDVTIIPMCYTNTNGVNVNLADASIKPIISNYNPDPLTSSWRKISSEFKITQENIDEIIASGDTPKVKLFFRESITDSNGNPLEIYFDKVSLVKIN